MAKTIGVFALILGLIGVGLGGYVFVNDTFFPAESSLQNTWFVQQDASCSLGYDSYSYLSPNSHLISVEQGESVYILFTGFHVSFGAFTAYYAIRLDGVPQTFTMLTSTGTGDQRMTIAIQYGISGLSSGTYNISVWGISNVDMQSCYGSALLVQTYL